MTAGWRRDQLVGCLKTWSATQRMMQTQGAQTVAELAQKIAIAWPNAQQVRQFYWPIYLRVGRV
ncbi:MAG: hypothetical protein F6J97_26610 [Leptolyngbya sp. SIO4C1]|nr:hypothetical protein [Leptolyngbya sp. SIO4C1]